MRRFKEQIVKYIGYEKPISKEEIEFELLSLKNLMHKLQLRSSELEKNMYLADLAIKKGATTLDQLFGESHENTTSKDGKKEENPERN